MLYHKRGILYLPLYRVYPHWRRTAPRGGWWCRGGWGKKLRRARRALGELVGEKKKSDNNQDFWFILFWLCWKYQTCANTHTPDVFLYTPPRSHTHAHTHNSSDRDRCRDALMHTHTFLVSHPAIVAQHHSPWCFTAVFPGTELSLVQSRLNKNSSHFQLVKRDFFSRHTLKPIPPLLLLKTYTSYMTGECWAVKIRQVGVRGEEGRRTREGGAREREAQ